MKKLIKNFANNLLSKEQMKNVKGGWCYAYSCKCGGSNYNGWGNLSDYRGDANRYCQGQGPVNCTFSGVPAGTRG